MSLIDAVIRARLQRANNEELIRTINRKKKEKMFLEYLKHIKRNNSYNEYPNNEYSYNNGYPNNELLKILMLLNLQNLFNNSNSRQMSQPKQSYVPFVSPLEKKRQEDLQILKEKIKLASQSVKKAESELKSANKLKKTAYSRWKLFNDKDVLELEQEYSDKLVAEKDSLLRIAQAKLSELQKHFNILLGPGNGFGKKKSKGTKR
jgi:hypothetical protein